MTSTRLRLYRYGACGLLAAAAAAVVATPGAAAAQRTRAGDVSDAGTASHGVGVTELRPGDRILLTVDGEKALSDTFIVHAGPEVDLPVIGPVRLAGVPRGDVERVLATAIARYIKSPVVHARALVRVGVIGEVAKPGFYALPFDAVVADALNAAGGLTRDARVSKIRLERGTKPVGDERTIQLALERGSTLDEIGVSGGDQLVVPRNRDTERLVRIIGVLVTIPAAIIAIVQITR